MGDHAHLSCRSRCCGSGKAPESEGSDDHGRSQPSVSTTAMDHHNLPSLVLESRTYTGGLLRNRGICPRCWRRDKEQRTNRVAEPPIVANGMLTLLEAAEEVPRSHSPGAPSISV